MSIALPVWDNSPNHSTFPGSSLAMPNVMRLDSVCIESHNIDLKIGNLITKYHGRSNVTNNPRRTQATQTKPLTHSDHLAPSPLVQIVHTKKSRTRRRRSVPVPFQISKHPIHQSTSSTYPAQQTLSSPASLTKGPAAYIYTPLSTRTQTYESLRYDHGIRFRKRLALREVFLHWTLLCDEDAAPKVYKERLVEYFKSRFGDLESKKEHVAVRPDDGKRKKMFRKVKKCVGKMMKRIRKVK